MRLLFSILGSIDCYNFVYIGHGPFQAEAPTVRRKTRIPSFSRSSWATQFGPKSRSFQFAAVYCGAQELLRGTTVVVVKHFVSPASDLIG
jgi:hypothetical protein